MSEEERDFSEDDEQIAEALLRFKQAIGENASIYFDVFEYEGIIDSLMEEAEVELAQEAINRALSQHPNAFEIQIKEVQVLLFNGEAIKALDALAILDEVEPDSVELQLLRGTACVQIGEVDEAIELYHNAYEQSGEPDSELAYDIALSLQQAGEYEKAIFFLEEAYHDTQTTSLLYELGYCCSKIDKYEEGIKYYEQYLNDDPLNSAVWYNLGINYNLIGQADKAIDAYDYAIALQETLDQAIFNKGNVLANTNRYTEAIEAYDEYLQLSPESEEGHFYIGDCYLATGQFKEACKHYQKAYELNPQNIEALHSIAIALMNEDKNEAALEIIKEVLALEKDNAIYLTSYGNANFELDRLDEAKEAYQKAIVIDPNCVVAWGSLADIESMDDKLENGLEVLLNALEKNSKDPYILSKIVIQYIDLEQEEEAVKYLKRGLKQDNEDTFKNLLNSQLVDVEDKDNEMVQRILKKLDR